MLSRRILNQFSRGLIKQNQGCLFSTKKEDFNKVLLQYCDKFNNSPYLEFITPRTLKNNEDLKKYSTQLLYAKENDLVSLNAGISAPVWDLLDRGGKRWRPALCVMIAEAFGKSINDIGEIAGLCEIAHNGTLVLDDIEDGSLLRRGKQCIHLGYGVDVGVNLGSFMQFVPLKRLLECDKYDEITKFKIAQIYTEELTSLHLGQCWDIIWHDAKKRINLPNQDQYLQMTAYKTGTLARLSSRLVCTVLGVENQLSRDIGRFAEKIGVAFQIQDDILNISGTDYKTKGELGEDISEGKITMMVIHSLQNLDKAKSQRLLDILALKTQDQALIKEAIAIINSTKSCEYAKTVAEKLIETCWTDLMESKIPATQAKQYLKDLANYTVSRQI